MRSLRVTRGVSLVDVIVGSALILIIFAGLFGLLRASVQVAGVARAKAAATAIATSQIEYVRSLSYGSIGTLGGIPAGLIAQSSTTTQAGTTFTVRTYVAYVDDVKDGSGGVDTNGITTDYKVVKVTVSYVLNNIAREVVLVTNAAPPGLETTTGGGTLQATVVDAVGVAVPGATVRIQNSSTVPAIDLSTFSDSLGVVYLPGAPTSTEYRLNVSKTGYSSAQTYARDATNQNPSPGYLTVAASQTTASSFAIDVLSTLIIRTFAPILADLFEDSFSTATNVAVLSNTQVIGDAITLAGASGTYVTSGTARSTTTAPLYLATWENASSTTDAPLGTNVTIHVTDGAGTLLPDAVLPGNTAGFTSTIDLSSISTTTYPSLALQALLSSADPLQTSSVLRWGLGYTAGPGPLPNVSFTLTGGKTVGSTGAGLPIYKTTVATTTDATGVRTLSLEWDSYDLVVTGYTIATSTPENPYELLPGTTVDASLILTP